MNLYEIERYSDYLKKMIWSCQEYLNIKKNYIKIEIRKGTVDQDTAIPVEYKENYDGKFPVEKVAEFEKALINEFVCATHTKMELLAKIRSSWKYNIDLVAEAEAQIFRRNLINSLDVIKDCEETVSTTHESESRYINDETVRISFDVQTWHKPMFDKKIISSIDKECQEIYENIYELYAPAKFEEKIEFEPKFNAFENFKESLNTFLNKQSNKEV